MIHSFTNYFLEKSSYAEVYGLTVTYFLFLYFGLGGLFSYTCKILYKNKLLNTIVTYNSSPRNTLFEIKHSIKSIFVFGFSGIVTVYFIRNAYISLLPDTLLNVVVGVCLLTLWNELYFFMVHRIMHFPFFYRRVHYIHHQSKLPTVYSVFSFHWLEALLLSSVSISISLLFDFSPMAIFLYPMASILLNFAGHCNYRLGNGTGSSWQLFGTRHAQHHFKNTNNYGFATHFFDWLFNPLNRKNYDK